VRDPQSGKERSAQIGGVKDWVIARVGISQNRFHQPEADSRKRWKGGGGMIYNKKCSAPSGGGKGELRQTRGEIRFPRLKSLKETAQV